MLKVTEPAKTYLRLLPEPFPFLKMSVRANMDVPADVLRTAVREASKRARDESFALGLTITVFEDGHLIRISPDGKREVIEDPYRHLSSAPE